MKPKILFLDEPVAFIKSQFLELCIETTHLLEADVVYTHMSPLYKKAPNLKVIVCPCTGIKHLESVDIPIIYLDDKEYLYKFVHSTAEYTIFSMLKMLRENGDELYNMNVGLIGGGGRLGRQVCDKLYGLTRTHPLVYDNGSTSVVNAIEVSSLEELYRQSDIISIHINETPWNQNFIDMVSLERMVDYGVKYLINSSRSSVLSADGLLCYANKFKGITLDVVEDYEDRQFTNLYGQKNITITNHKAGSMKPSRIQTDTYVLNKFKKWVDDNWHPETITVLFNGVEYGELEKEDVENVLKLLKNKVDERNNRL